MGQWNIFHKIWGRDIRFKKKVYSNLPWAGLSGLAGRIWPTGLTFPTPGLHT